MWRHLGTLQLRLRLMQTKRVRLKHLKGASQLRMSSSASRMPTTTSSFQMKLRLLMEMGKFLATL